MNPYDRVPQTTARRRRAERNAEAYGADGRPLMEPSMNAPQPMPGATSIPAPTPRRTAAPLPPVMQAPEQVQAVPVSQAIPPVSQAVPPMAQNARSGQAPQVSSHRRAAQHSYAPSAAPQGGYAAPDGNYQQPYTGQQAEWSQPYAQQPVNGWNQPMQGQPNVPYGQHAVHHHTQPNMPQGQPGMAQGQPNMPPVQPNMPPAQPAQNGWHSGPYPTQNAWQGQVQQPARSDAGPGHIHMRPPRKGGGTWKWIVLALAVVAVIAAATMLGRNAVDHSKLREQVTAYDSLFCEGVYVDGIHLGGMTQEQAMNVVSANAQQRRDQWNVRLTYQGGLVRAVSADDLHMTVDVTAALSEAWEQGHASGDYAERKAAMDALRTDPYHGYTALSSGSAAAIDAIMQEIYNLVYRAPVDAQMVGFDPLLTYPFIIQQETVGRALNTAPTKEKLAEMAETMQSGSIELDVVETYPAVTEASLQKQLTLRGRAYTQISTTSTQERTDNIRRAFEIMSGTVIEPGKTFSFNGVVGERSAKNGFYQAIEYAYGEERMGYGGGVCQASTTVYLAAIRANLEIVKREPHSDKVNYTEYGLDATVNFDGKKIDLVFKNNTDSNIYIKASVQKDPKISKSHHIAVVEIWGADLGEGVSYDLVAETVEILPPPAEPEYREDKKGEYVTYIDQEHIYREAKEGCRVDSYKVKYVNGEETERTFMYRDTYNPKTKIIYVGITNREPGYWDVLPY